MEQMKNKGWGIWTPHIDAPDESEPSFHINNGACDEEAYGGMLETRRKQDEERLAEKLKRGTRGFALGTNGGSLFCVLILTILLIDFICIEKVPQWF